LEVRLLGSGVEKRRWTEVVDAAMFRRQTRRSQMVRNVHHHHHYRQQHLTGQFYHFSSRSASDALFCFIISAM